MAGGQLEFDPGHDDAIRAAAQTAYGSGQHSYELAGWWVRVGAYLIDGLILVVGLLVVVFVALAINKVLGVIVAIAAFFVYFLGYWTYFEGGETGQTLGKRAVGIRVRSVDGGPAGYSKAFLRNLVARVIGLFPFVGLIDVLWPLWDDKKQCLHDKAASTVVVRD